MSSISGLIITAAAACHAHTDPTTPPGMEIWRKSLTSGADTPMRAEMLMTQRKHGKVITTRAHIVQGRAGRYRMEYLLPEEARGRIVFSDGRTNWQFEPAQNMLAKTDMVAMSEQRDRGLERLIESNYSIALEPARSSAAGRPSYVVDLTPRHAGKSSQRRWIDRKTFKTLRIETHYTDGILARMVAYDKVVQPAGVSDSEFKPDSNRTTHTITSSTPSVPIVHSIPDTCEHLKLRSDTSLGFHLIEVSSSEINKLPATQLLYSDGIETVSVFAQDGAAAVSTIPADWTKVAVGNETAFQNIDGHLDALTWNRAGFRYTAVSHLTPQALKAFVESEL